MARSRNIKPGFFLNDELAEIEPLGRLLFIGLWTLADREGRLEDRPKKIKAAILPYDNCNIDKLLQALYGKGFIVRYLVSGDGYIQVVNFTKHQNPHMKEQASEIPAPDLHHASTVLAPNEHGSCPADSLLLIPDSLNPLIDSLNPPKNGAGVVKKIAKKHRDELFALFWSAYPKKKSKGEAEKAWAKIPLDESLADVIMLKLDEVKASHDWTKENGQYIPYPATWLNAKGWEDESSQIQSVPQGWHGIKSWADKEGVDIERS